MSTSIGAPRKVDRAGGSVHSGDAGHADLALVGATVEAIAPRPIPAE
jgi:hypothetical protein